MPKIFDQEAKDRAVRLVEDRIRVQECSIVKRTGFCSASYMGVSSAVRC